MYMANGLLITHTSDVLLYLIGISSAHYVFEVLLDHMADMWIFTTISRAFCVCCENKTAYKNVNGTTTNKKSV